MAGDNAPVIKRIKKVTAGGHHGGAWKVDYADFVTAMMAFFLLMWLINTTTPEQKRGIADYFAAQNVAKTTSGAGGVLGGAAFGVDGARAAGSNTTIEKLAPPKPKENAVSKTDEQSKGGKPEEASTSQQAQASTEANPERVMPSNEKRLFEQAEESLRQAMQQMPDIAELSRNIIMNITPDGLNIQLVDQDGQPIFQPGTANLLPKTRQIGRAHV